MLELDHTKRIKPSEVLDHPYFNEIRQEREQIDAQFDNMPTQKN